LSIRSRAELYTRKVLNKEESVSPLKLVVFSINNIYKSNK